MTTPNIPAMPARGADWQPWADAVDGAVRGLPADYVSTDGGSTITLADPTVVGLVVEGAVGQTGNLVELNNSDGAPLLVLDNDGTINSRHLIVDNTGAVGSVSVVPLTVKGRASQSANLAEFQDSSGTILCRVRNNGDFYIGENGDQRIYMGRTADIPSQTKLGIVTHSASLKGLVVKGSPSQTNNLAEFQSSAGTILAAVSSTGAIHAANAIVAQGSSANAFAAILAQPTDPLGSGLIVRGAVSQTGNLTEFQNNAGTKQAAISSFGQIQTIGGSGATFADTGYQGLLMGNCGANPPSSPVAGGFLYVVGSQLRFKAANGNVYNVAGV